MTNYNATWQIAQVDSSKLVTDPIYQREVDEKRVTKIMKNFNPYLVNFIKVSHRDGKYYMFDGQHTKELLKRRNGGKDLKVWCKVYEGLTRLDEMELFVAQNGESSPVSTIAKYRALFGMGDPDIIGMVKGCNDVGVAVLFTTSRAKNSVVALKTLFVMYKTLDFEDYKTCIEILKEAWKGSPEGFSREILNGMMRFYKLYGNEVNKKRLTSKLASVEPTEIIREGKASIYTGADKYARIIFNLYNGAARVTRLEDKF